MKPRISTPRSRPRVSSRLPRDAAVDQPNTVRHVSLKEALRLSQDLGDAGPDPVQRKRRLLAGLCELVRADRALVAVTHTCLSSGRQTVISVLAVRMVLTPPTTARRSRSGRPSASGDRANGDARVPSGLADSTDLIPGTFAAIDPAIVEPDITAGSRRCLDDFVWLDGLKLAACITLFRPQGDRPFDVVDRSLVEAIHAQSAWVYAHDRQLAAVAGGLTPFDRQVLQDLLSGHDAAAIAARWRKPVGQVRESLSAVLARWGVDSREALVERWAAA